MIHVSHHAIERYIERVEAVSELEALAEIRAMLERSKFFGRVGAVKKGRISLVIEGRPWSRC